jgi:mono/diheme cytochrome c family protein
MLLLSGMASCAETKPLKQAWRPPAEAVEKINPIPYTVESVVKGKNLFEQYCQKCHGYWGEGNGVVGLSLNQNPANLLRIAGKKAEGEFAWKIAEGRDDMPGFKKILTEDEIWNIVNFVESLENEQGSSDPVARK